MHMNYAGEYEHIYMINTPVHTVDEHILLKQSLSENMYGNKQVSMNIFFFLNASFVLQVQNN